MNLPLQTRAVICSLFQECSHLCHKKQRWFWFGVLRGYTSLKIFIAFSCHIYMNNDLLARELIENRMAGWFSWDWSFYTVFRTKSSFRLAFNMPIGKSKLSGHTKVERDLKIPITLGAVCASLRQVHSSSDLGFMWRYSVIHRIIVLLLFVSTWRLAMFLPWRRGKAHFFTFFGFILSWIVKNLWTSAIGYREQEMWSEITCSYV